MFYRAAIRWVITGKETLPQIHYMVLNPELEYLIYPKIIAVTNVKKDLKTVFEHIESHNIPKDSLIINYKSINKHFYMHRRDSGKFHYYIQKNLKKRKLLRANSRSAFLLKKEDLKMFKKALFLLDIDCKSRGHAFITHLWAIALKATPSRLPLVIKQIWKARCSVKRMKPEDNELFLEFYSHCY